jgi:hypothetical protein
MDPVNLAEKLLVIEPLGTPNTGDAATATTPRTV